jgi:TrmH family RNA methyltransferase
MSRNGNDENLTSKRENRSEENASAPAQKQTAVMKKQLTTRANSYEFFSKKTPPSTNDSTRLILVAVAFPENIGTLILIAGKIDAKKSFIFTGEQSNFKSKKIQRAATSNAYMSVPFEFCSEKEWPTKIPKEYQLVAVETVSHANKCLSNCSPTKICLVVGNESFGITEWSLQQCKTAMYLPMPGRIKSLNVSQAATFVMFERQRRQCYS